MFLDALFLTTPFNDISAVIFDLDGTLLTSNIDFIKMKVDIGCPNDQDILAYVASLPSKLQYGANRVISEHEMTDAKDACWIEGAKHCITSLGELQLPMAVVTRNCRDAVALKMSNNNVPIDYIVTREDGPPKPDPTTLIEVARQWKIDPRKIVYVGDYLYDVQAANNAGMVSCLYANGRVPEYAHLADYMFSDFNTFLQDLKESANLQDK